ncbi:DUF1129 domain-containing protein [Jeotgalibaca porci]|uniref:DUF1129 domain-containing protein n=1 Tax=Jeotgalibaca porci TaxID=1868793 RepID=A0A6G7WH76_9LACT|nr:DUF1129 family protein [Jeotgalibaca porci]QIK51567.1 DUF1129 domain-containing protein [Jeotgalibaca porci]
MSENTLEQTKNENSVLWSELTKRNEQYMIGLDRALTQANYDEESKHTLYNKMMKELVTNQKSGTTARQLYGTVSECAENVLQRQEATVSSERSPDWLIALDGGLLLGAIFALISGTSLLTAGENTQPGMGIVSLILNFIAGGLSMLIVSKYQPDVNAPKGKKGYFKYIGVLILSMVFWMLAMTATMVLVPPAINISLPATAYLIIGALSFALRVYLKKKFNITGGVF